jgi:hypothetical protein
VGNYDLFHALEVLEIHRKLHPMTHTSFEGAASLPPRATTQKTTFILYDILCFCNPICGQTHCSDLPCSLLPIFLPSAARLPQKGLRRGIWTHRIYSHLPISVASLLLRYPLLQQGKRKCHLPIWSRKRVFLVFLCLYGVGVIIG